MATNEQIITRIDTLENNVTARFERIEEDIEKNAEDIKQNNEDIKHQDDELRGNSHPGIKARLSSVEKYIAETKRWQQAIILMIIADIVTRVLTNLF